MFEFEIFHPPHAFADYLRDADAFNARVQDDAKTFKPFGTLVNEYARQEENGREEYEVYHVCLADRHTLCLFTPPRQHGRPQASENTTSVCNSSSCYTSKRGPT